MADNNAQIVVSAKDSTATAFQSIQARLTTLKATLAGVAGGAAFAGLQQGAELLATAFEKIDPSSVFEAADALDKLSQRTGIATSNLDALTYQGKLLGISQDDLTTSLKRFNVNVAAAAAGSQEQAKAFNAVGISQKFLKDNIGDTGKVLGAFADKIASYSDGANKVAIVNAAGGKSFELLIPLLNQGSKGFADAKAELEALGGALGTDLVAKSKTFEENLTKLGVAAGALKVVLAGSVIDKLVDVSDRLIEGAKNSTLFASAFSIAVDNIRDAASKLPGFGIIFGGISASGGAVDAAKKNIDDLTAKIVKLQDTLSKNPGMRASAQLAHLQEQLKAAQDAANAPQLRATDAFRRSEAAGADFSPAKTKAPALPDPAAAEAALNKATDDRLKVIQAGLEKEKLLFQFANQQLDDQFAHGELSIDAFYDAKEKRIREDLSVQLDALEQSIAAEQHRKSLATNPKDSADAVAKITVDQQKIGDAVLSTSQQIAAAETQRSRAAQEFQKNLASLDAQIDALSDNQAGAAFIKNAEQVKAARDLLAKGPGGADTDEAKARLNALGLALDTQTRFADASRATSLIIDQEQTAEAAFGITADRTGKSQIEVNAQLKEYREGAIVQLDAQIAQLELITNKTADQKLALDKLKLARDKAFDAKDPTLLQFQDVINQTGTTLASGLDDAIASGKKLDDVFKDVEVSLVKLLAHDFLTAPLAISLENFVKDATGIGGQQSGGLSGSTGLLGLLGGLFGPSTGTATVGGASTLTSTDISALFGSFGYGHAGGIAGAFPTTMPVSPSVFAHADRYHGGGIVGGETPAILQKGEEVITQSDPRHRWNGGMNGSGQRPVTVQNTFVLQQPASRDTQSQIAVQAGRGIQRAMARDT